MSWRERVTNWLDERAGLPSLRSALLDRHVPSGLNWLYVLGSACLFIFLVQAVTGMLLAMNYAPSPERAHDAVSYITEHVPFGAFLRGLHKWGATFMVVFVVLHLLRTYFMAAFKRPRELTWIVGIGLLLLTLGFGFTGYLLPWDQKAYWATQVGVNIGAQVPFIGGFIGKVMRGGEYLGTVTLPRFYAIHVLILPAVTGGLILAHLFLVVWHGISAPPDRQLERRLPADPAKAWGAVADWYKRRKEEGLSFHPFATVKDALATFVILLALSGLSLWLGAELEAVADPTDTTYNPRPEWYFLFLFEALKYFPGHLEALVAVVLPGVGVGLLLLMPFLDRSARRHPLHRPYWTGLGVVTLAGVAWLTVQGARAPMVNPSEKKNPMIAEGRRLFNEFKCNHCHSVRGKGGIVGPDLATIAAQRDPAWIKDHLLNPRESNGLETMPRFNLIEEETDRLVAFVASLGAGGYTVRAPALYAENCSMCHALHGEGGDVGPDLSEVGLYRDEDYLSRYIADPAAVNPDAEMPGFQGMLANEEAQDLARFLAAQKGGESNSLLVNEGRRLFDTLKCIHCHRVENHGGRVGPDLTRVASRHGPEWIKEHFRNPRKFSTASTMPSFDLEEQEMDSLIAFLRKASVAGTQVPAAAAIFKAHCAMCHVLNGKGEEVGPDLSAIGTVRSADWLASYIEDPTKVYPDVIMPKFKGMLSASQIGELARYLASMRGSG